MKNIENSTERIIKIIKQLNIFTIDELKQEIILNEKTFYSDELIEHILLYHPNIKNSYGTEHLFTTMEDTIRVGYKDFNYCAPRQFNKRVNNE